MIRLTVPIYRIFLIFFAMSLLTSCVALNNPFAAKTATRTNACKVDLSLPVELERAVFIPPEIWSRIEPCDMVKINRLFKQDSWGISATLNYTYADVLVYDTAMGFGVEGNLNWIGDTPTTLDGWKQREDDKWKKYIKARKGTRTRKVSYASRNGLECWRVESKSYDKDKQSALSIAYDCWANGKTHYPPLSIGGSIRYWEGKPVYDLDIDKDLIDPVFATLEVKDIKPEVYAERMAAYKKKEKRQCKGRIKYVRKNPNKGYTVSDIDLLEDCGYDTSKLKRKEE